MFTFIYNFTHNLLRQHERHSTFRDVRNAEYVKVTIILLAKHTF